MNKFLGLILITGLLSGCSSLAPQSASKNWKQESDKLTKEYFFVQGRIRPEMAPKLNSLDIFESKATSFSKDFETVISESANRWKENLLKRLRSNTDPELEDDIRILLNEVNRDLEFIELDKRVGTVPFLNISAFVSQSIVQIIPMKNPPARKLAHAMARFRTYVRGDVQQLPLVDGFMEYMQESMDNLAKNSRRGYWPSELRVKLYLNHSEENLNFLEGFIKDWPGTQWKRDFKEFRLQELRYRKFIVKKILPYCRKSTVISEDLYNIYLKKAGIDISAEDLVTKAKNDYKKTYKEFLILKGKGPKSGGTEIETNLAKAYGKAGQDLHQLVRENKLLTLIEDIGMTVELSSSKPNPLNTRPHFIFPSLDVKNYSLPKLILFPKMEEEYKEPATILNFMATEFVPGNSLYIDHVKDKKPTMARKFFALNRLKMDGWRYYSEVMLYPYLDDKSKLVFLHSLLFKQARAFIDPLFHLGLIKKSEIEQVLVKELGFSKDFLENEIVNMLKSPAEGAAAYHGFTILDETKTFIKKRLGASFSDRCFNDAVLVSPIVPLRKISDLLKKNLSCVD